MKKNILVYAATLFIGGSMVLTSCKKDEEAPVISLKGDSVQTVVLNAALSDPGASANDNKDGDVSANITSDYLTKVMKDSAGTYTVTYSVTDAKDNTGSKTRTVIVKNDAETFYAGTYNASEVDTNGLYTYSGNTDAAKVVTITPSSSKNNRIWITRLGDFANNKSYLDITGSSIDLPSQTSQNIGTGAGCEVASHTFSGTGTKTSNGFTLNYTDTKLAPCSGVRNAAATFVKK